jgi:hypothetical protein
MGGVPWLCASWYQGGSPASRPCRTVCGRARSRTGHRAVSCSQDYSARWVQARPTPAPAGGHQAAPKHMRGHYSSLWTTQQYVGTRAYAVSKRGSTLGARRQQPGGSRTAQLGGAATAIQLLVAARDCLPCQCVLRHDAARWCRRCGCRCCRLRASFHGDVQP